MNYCILLNFFFLLLFNNRFIQATNNLIFQSSLNTHESQLLSPPAPPIFIPKIQQTSRIQPTLTRYRLTLTSANTCGTIKPQITHLISNGKLTSHNIWPWNVQLIIQLNNVARSKVYCGGTIISNEYILTAAHCFDQLTPYERAINTLIVFNSIYTDKSKNVLKMNAEQIIQNPAYIGTTKKDIGFVDSRRLFTSYSSQTGPKHDLALVKFNFNKLNENIKKSAYAQLSKVCLPKLNLHLTEGTKCKILGQGFRNSNDEVEYLISQQLQYAEVILSTNEKCRLNVDSNYVKEKINADTLCINGNVHPCVGDSGGSLICSDESGRWFIMGVTSFAVSSSNKDKCGNFKSAVFAKVPNYINWIRSHLNE